MLNATVEAGRKGKFLEKNTVRLVERFQWPLAFGLWCLLVSFYYEFPVRAKPRDIRLTPATGPRQAAARSLAGAALVLLCLLAFTAPLPAAAPTPPATMPLSKIIGRLATQPECSARDWAEMAGETVLWGQNIQSTQQPVPAGPVQDALAAVTLGSALDAKTANWPKLRADLEALLQKPEDQKKEQQKQDQKNQDQQKQDQQKQDSKSSSKNQQSQDQSQPQKKEPSSEQQQPKPEKSEEQKKQESAFGDMKQHEPPPPPMPAPGETQKVGGVPEKKEAAQPLDPAMAVPLQKLDQLRNQDSPAELFQMMDADKKPVAPKKKSKDW